MVQFATNTEEFDFPFRDKVPSIPYIIASTPRCGSNLLQRALWRTGLAGAPEEYLTGQYLADFCERLSVTSRLDSGAQELDDYIRALWQIRTSPNGVFGLKLHGSHLHRALESESLISSLRGSQWLWMRRQNKIAQAISYLIADQTGVWIIDGEWLPRSNPVGDPVYDASEISERLKQIVAEESIWTEFFELSHMNPYILYYEQLVDDYNGTLSEIFNFLGIRRPSKFTPAGIERQASKINLAWETRYRGEI